jgi:hypothetical protein
VARGVRVERGGLCPARADAPGARFSAKDVLFTQHVCELSNLHFGVHLCWCGTAFRDDGTLFSQVPVQRHLGQGELT